LVKISNRESKVELLIKENENEEEIISRIEMTKNRQKKTK